ncbi:hypothetical protein [Emergencia sp.]|uniref:hypothetical protein n=1 Tax=Emergencia sp. TaxID=1926557 RepID=UPI003AF0AD93
MSDKIVIDINSKGVKTARRDLERFQSSLVGTNRKINDLNKSEVLLSIAAENNKFLQVLDKTNMHLKEFQNAQILAFYAIKSSIDGMINSMSLRLESLLGRTYKIPIRLEGNSALKQVNVLENRLNNLSGNIVHNTEEKKNQPKTVIGVEKNKKTQEDQSTVRRKTLKDKVEDVKDYLHQKKEDFKVDPIGTGFSTAMEVLDYIGRFQTIKEGVKGLKNLKKSKKSSSKLPPHISDEGAGNNTKPEKSFLKKDGRIRQGARKATDFIKGKAPVAKEAIKSYGSRAKSAISSGGARTARALKNVGSNAKYLVTNNAGKVARGGAALGRRGLTAGTQLVTKLGAVGTAGAAVTVMGVADGGMDVYKGLKADNKYDKKYETTKGVAKMSGTLAGAAAGSMILPGIGTIVGGIGGYLLGKFGGEKAAEKVAGGSEGAAKYADKSENAAIKVAKDSTPQFEKLQQQLAGIQGKEERSELISSFTQEMSDTTKALTALAEKNEKANKETPEEVQDYLTKINHLELMAAGLDLPEQFRKTKMQANTDQKSNSVIQKQDPIPTELQIDGNKVINGQSPITPEELGVPPFLATTTDVYCKINRIIGEPPVNTKSSTTKGNRTKGTGKTIAAGMNAVSKVIQGAFNMLKGFRSGGIVGGNVPGFAEGGYVQGGAQLITVAEEGTPEAIIPLGKHRRKRAMELFGQVGSYLQAPGFVPKGFAAGGIVGGSIGGGFGGGMPTVVEVGGVEIKVEAKDGQNLVETIRENKEAISEEIAGVFNAAFKGQFANTPASGGASA